MLGVASLPSKKSTAATPGWARIWLRSVVAGSEGPHCDSSIRKRGALGDAAAAGTEAAITDSPIAVVATIDLIRIPGTAEQCNPHVGYLERAPGYAKYMRYFYGAAHEQFPPEDLL